MTVTPPPPPPPPEAAPESAVERQALAVRDRAHAIAVRTPAEYESAVNFLRETKAIREAIEQTFDPAIKAAHDAHKAVLAAKRRHLDPVDDAERHVKGLVGAYTTEQQRLAREAQRAAEEERARLARAAEEERLRREAVNLYPSTEDALPPPPPEEPPPAPPPLPIVPAAPGVQVRAKWVADVTDLAALVRAVATGAAPLHLLAADATALRKFAEATKGTASIPGVAFRQESVVAVRG